MKPTVGAVVHYYDDIGGTVAQERGPHTAFITRVHSDTCVNLTIFPDRRLPVTRTSIVEKPPTDDHFAYWEWPPRQGEKT